MAKLAPWEVKQATLSQLHKTWVKMMSAEWFSALDGASEDERKAAGMALLRVQSARIQLKTSLTAEIRDELIQQEKALEQGRKALAKALENLGKFKKVLETVNKFLDAIGKVVTLVV